MIGEPLQLGAVVGDGHVALLQGAQLGLQIHSALHLVALEQPFDGVLEGEGILAIPADGVEDTLGDGGEDPVDDASIHHAPLAIMVFVRGGMADMALEAEFGECGVKEETQLAIVAFVHVKNDRDLGR